MRAVFQDFAREPNRIANVLKRGDGTGAKCSAVHDDGVAFDAPIEIQVRTVARVEDGIVFQNDDGCFDGVECGAARLEDLPAGG